LTTNLEVSRALGTRHRAAIGLTDDTDAVVLVVSEEEGRVSLVQGGRIRVMPDAEALRSSLQKIFGVRQTRRLLRLTRAE
jgi:diadenylate cyclase